MWVAQDSGLDSVVRLWGSLLVKSWSLGNRVERGSIDRLLSQPSVETKQSRGRVDVNCCIMLH